MEGFAGPDILQLAQLLKPPYEEDDFDDKQKVKPVKTKKSDTLKPKIVKHVDEENDEEDEIAKLEKQLENAACLEESDWRTSPQWNLIYKQAVTPSDVFLQIGNKTELTSSCEEMVITIDLPGEKAPGIDVKVTKENLKLLTPKFRLDIPLPHTVDPQLGNAKWDGDKEQLVLTLKMDREFDYINF